MKNTIKKIVSVLIIMMMILPICLPIVSKAVDSGTSATSEQDYPLNIVLERDETNPNLIHITATDTESNITDLKYVHQYIDTDNIGYFEEEHEEIYTFDITPAQTIEETFELDGYGSYTVYAKNEKGYAFLARLTVNDPNDMPQITLTKEKDSLNLNIEVTSNKNTITKLKIAKKEHINDNIDFSQQGKDIEFMESNHVSVRYTEITEEGLYVIYAEDSEGNKTTRQIYIAKQNTPISVQITNGTNTREVHLNITDAICKIVSVKVAKLSEIGEDYDKFDTIEGLSITEGQTVNVSYTAPEDDTYMFCIEDEAGYKLFTQKRITAQEKVMNVTIEQDENSPGNLTITATNTICDIVEMKVAIGDDIDMDYFENNGESISIEPGREVVGKYTVQENCTINVYVKDKQGYSHIYTKTLIGIDTPEPEPSEAPTITLTQNTQNPKQIDVYVQADHSNVDEIKWAEGEQNLAYFETNGIRIGQDKVGVAIHTEFTINAIGTYTVYAKDDNGNVTVKTIEITNIDETPPTEEDTTPPEVNNVQDNGIYNTSVTPNIVDEHLAEIYLTIDGLDVEDYQNGDTIEEEGAYVLNAVDEAGNEVVVKFIIDKTAPEITINQENTDNENVEVSISLLDNLTNINMVKVARGEQAIEYFEDGGQELNLQKEENSALAAINVMENGTYTVYFEDEAGNAKIEVFEVTTITEDPEIDDTTPPKIQTSNESINENESIKVTIHVTDTQSQIAVIKIANGEQNTDYFEDEGNSLQMITDDKSAEAAVMITKNGTYTIYAEDEQGNKTVTVITITEIVTPAPTPDPDPNPNPDDTTPPTITGVQDGMTYGIALTPKVEDENLAGVTLTRNGNIVEDYQNGDTITENGTYVLTATDEAGNKTVVRFVINIQPEENEDKTPPTITGVEDGMTYNKEVAPIIEDENLAKIILTRNGNVIENYESGDTISENGTYVLTAIDQAGNQTIVEFVIDIQENNDNNNDDNNDDNNDNNNTNDNNNGNDNTNTGNNNDGDTNTDNTNNNNQNGGTNNSNIGETNNDKNIISNSGKNNISTSNSKLPYTGLGNILIIGIVITSGVAIFTYIKYKKYKI